MSDFIQLHLLTAYPPSNLNRDDLGRPKTAQFGGTQRLRISSQSLKRAWRTSPLFMEVLTGHIGTRTKGVGNLVLEGLSQRGLERSRAEELARRVVAVFGKGKSDKKAEAAEDDVETPKGGGKKKGTKAAKASAEGGADLRTEQLVHISAAELAAIEQFIEGAAKGGDVSDAEVKRLLGKGHGSADIALFGRMLADATDSNVEAAAQVAHAITVHKVTVEDDYFTAVDDLNDGSDNLGAAHVGVSEFASGVFYQYICVDRASLVSNLDGDEALVRKTLRALGEACLKVSPAGKQASFGSRAYASYGLAERGAQQPRSLAVAFLQAVEDADVLGAAVKRLESMRGNMDRVYGPCCDRSVNFNAHTGEGSLASFLEFVGN